MFDIDSGKLLILGVIALIVIKPKDLPGVMRQVGATIGQLRRMAAEFQGQFKDAMREAELDELKKDMAKVADLDGLDPFTEVRSEIDQTRTAIESSLNKPIGENAFAESIEPPAEHGLPAHQASPPAHEISPHQSSPADHSSPAPDPAPPSHVSDPARSSAST